MIKNDKDIMVRLKHETMNPAKLHRQDAIRNLEKIKTSRKGKRFKLVPIDGKTCKEVEIK